ncbi:MAG: DnaJ domain-containing protein [Clostridiales bacterium]|nr:DnaJ domain-containing protein [Clostridiales bacterium]
MIDPYEILGVSSNATDEEIKNAYREQARKYQKDNYENSPLADYAALKLKELDEAYDSIIEQRRGKGYRTSSGGSTAYTSSSSTYSSSGGYSAPTYSNIRERIRKNDLNIAQKMLNDIPEDNRIAEWYYLQGMIQHKKGWVSAAYENYERAYRMDPSNAEYGRAFQNLHEQRTGGYRQSHSRNSDSGCSFCNMCQGLICADCCCELMGGDLIPCC